MLMKSRQVIPAILGTLTMLVAMVMLYACGSSMQSASAPPTTDHVNASQTDAALVQMAEELKSADCTEGNTVTPSQNQHALIKPDAGGAGARQLDYAKGAGVIDLDAAKGMYRQRVDASGSAPALNGVKVVPEDKTLAVKGTSGVWDSSASRGAASASAPAEAGVRANVGVRAESFDPTVSTAADRRAPDLITRINPGEELWIIVEADDAYQRPANDDEPGSGSLVTILPGRDGFVPVPLEHTAVTGNVSGYIASVDVKQTFHNPYDTKIEAVYVFPLPENAAVRDFLMTIGSRTIRGVIREREEANRIYEQAKAQGHVASIMNQERPNIFTQKVANIEPGKRIDVDITYFNTLAYSDGWFEFVFPMVVGPRYNPASIGNAGIGAAQLATPGSTGQAVEVAYLRPDQRSGHDISVDLRIDAGMEIEDVKSKSHRIEVSKEGPNVRRVRLADSDTVPNKDLVVRYRVAGEKVKSALFTRVGDDGAGYFTMLLVPPQLPSHLEREPVEFVFVLDTSGSMNGEPLRLAKEAVREALGSMREDDTFQIINFNSSVSQLGSRPLAATARNIRLGREYLDGLCSGGGTEMLNGIRASLDFPLDEGRQRFVVFLTDGYIGNEAQILAEIDRKIGDSRIFSFGIGSSVNRFLMDEMAKTGQGAVAYIGVRDRARETMAMFFERVSHPAVCNVQVDLGALSGAEMYPAQVPDLFVGRPVVISGRYDASAAGNSLGDVRIRGTAGGRRISMVVEPDAQGADRTGALEAIWARAKIASLSNSALRGDSDGELTDAIRQVALAHGIMSQFTSFLAVDSMSITEGDHGVTVPVPVPVPEGVNYTTTVGSTGDR